MTHAILTCDEVRAAEQRAVEAGISLWALMRKAGQACADVLHAEFPEGRVVVLRAAVASVPTPAEAAEAAEADANASDPALVDDTDAPRRRTGLWVGIGVGVAVVALALGLGFGLSGRGTSGVDATFSTLGARP